MAKLGNDPDVKKEVTIGFGDQITIVNLYEDVHFTCKIYSKSGSQLCRE